MGTVGVALGACAFASAEGVAMVAAVAAEVAMKLRLFIGGLVLPAKGKGTAGRRARSSDVTLSETVEAVKATMSDLK